MIPSSLWIDAITDFLTVFATSVMAVMVHGSTIMMPSIPALIMAGLGGVLAAARQLQARRTILDPSPLLAKKGPPA